MTLLITAKPIQQHQNVMRDDQYGTEVGQYVTATKSKAAKVCCFLTKL